MSRDFRPFCPNRCIVPRLLLDRVFSIHPKELKKDLVCLSVDLVYVDVIDHLLRVTGSMGVWVDRVSMAQAHTSLELIIVLL